MTQAISVYISKAISEPMNHLDLILNLEQQKYVTIWNKATTTHNTWCQSFVLHMLENLWLFVMLRSEHTHSFTFHFTGAMTRRASHQDP